MANDDKHFSKRLTLMLIENNSEHSLESDLSCYFHDIIKVNTNTAALESFHNNHIDMILLNFGENDDIPMKFDLIKQIKKIKPFIITIIHSCQKSLDILERSVESGIDVVLHTPLNRSKIFKALKKIKKRYLFNEEYETSKQNINLLKQYKDIADKSTIISKTDKQGKIIYANDNFCKISGYSKNELVGENHNMIRHPDNPSELYKDMWDTIKIRKQEWNGILKNITKKGKPYYVKSTITPILDKEGNIMEYIALRDNISSIMSDKTLFLDKINSNILSLLILVQINEFDMLEKFYNLTTIDQIEKIFGYNLLSYLPKEYKFDNVYHLENGRYALITDLYDFWESDVQIKSYLEQFVKNVKESKLEIENVDYDINISLSYAYGKYMLYEDAKSGLEESLEKNIIVCHSNDFSLSHKKEASKNLQVIKMVKIALDNYNIISYFQPIINNKTKQIDKYESLVRLIDEQGNVLAPYHFLNISKKGHYYNKITHRVLENTFKILKKITTKLSINFSALDLENNQMTDLIYQFLDQHKEERDRLIFELLEDENIQNFEKVRKFIKKVKAMGIKIAIDDFGVGYSNFERLLEFEPDIIKIDGSLVRNITKDRYSRDVVESIVKFAKKQNILTIAEFVENEEIFNLLSELEVDYSQGYYFGKPEELKL
jgi:PAS domain S-box-containing protein